MTKILLVEDDKSLREIYGVRLLAEGYDIVSAGDGEAALAMAIKDRPALIVSDVMMPKISGFDMLDVLRSTTETKDIKVIMMTALSSEDQRKRGEQLGADKYLVKSQVGIEDVVRAVHDVLGDAPTSSTAASPFATPAPTAVAATPQQQPAPTPVAPPRPVVAAPPTTPAPTPISIPVTPVAAAPAPAPTATPTPLPPPQSAAATPAPLPQPTAPFSTPRPGTLADRVIQPLSKPTNTSSTPVADLMSQELAGGITPAPVASEPTPAPIIPPTPPAPTPAPQQQAAPALTGNANNSAPVAPFPPSTPPQAPAV